MENPRGTARHVEKFSIGGDNYGKTIHENWCLFPCSLHAQVLPFGFPYPAE